jgi:hypothetical protein
MVFDNHGYVPEPGSRIGRATVICRNHALEFRGPVTDRNRAFDDLRTRDINQNRALDDMRTTALNQNRAFDDLRTTALNQNRAFDDLRTAVSDP